MQVYLFTSIGWLSNYWFSLTSAKHKVQTLFIVLSWQQLFYLRICLRKLFIERCIKQKKNEQLLLFRGLPICLFLLCFCSRRLFTLKMEMTHFFPRTQRLMIQLTFSDPPPSPNPFWDQSLICNSLYYLRKGNYLETSYCEVQLTLFSTSCCQLQRSHNTGSEIRHQRRSTSNFQNWLKVSLGLYALGNISSQSSLSLLASFQPLK